MEGRLGGGGAVGAPRAGLGGLARALGAWPGGRAGWGRAAGLAVGVGAAAAVLAVVALPRPLVRLAARHFRRKCIFEMPPRKGGERKCAPVPLSPAPCARPRAPLLPHPTPSASATVQPGMAYPLNSPACRHRPSGEGS